MDRTRRASQPPAKLTYNARGVQAEVRQAAGISGLSRSVVRPENSKINAPTVLPLRNTMKSNSPVGARPPSATQKTLKELESQKLILDEEDKYHQKSNSLEENISEVEEKIRVLEQTWNNHQFDGKEEYEIPDNMKDSWRELQNDLNAAKSSLLLLNKHKSRLKDELDRKINSINKRLELEKRQIEVIEEGTLDEEVAQFNDNQNLIDLESRQSPVISEGQRRSAFRPISRGFQDDDSCGYYEDEDFEDEENNFHQEPNQQADVVQQLTAALSKAFGSKSGNSDSKLPFFDGNPGNWCTFKSAYQRSNRKYKFDKSENLMRLREALKGQAKQAVDHLMANPGNVKKIMEVLEMRFGRAELVLDYLVDKARSCKPVQLTQPESIVEFGTMVDALITNIDSFRMETYINDRHLLMELVKKLPGQMQTQWYEWLVDRQYQVRNLRVFSIWIQPKVEAALFQVKPKTGEEKEKVKRGAVIHSASTTTEDSTEKVCYCCDRKNHVINDCRIFKKSNTEERWSIVKEKQLCFSCLEKGHVSPKCRAKLVCSVEGCKGKHHSLLHRHYKNDLESLEVQDRKNLERLQRLKDIQVPHRETDTQSGNQPKQQTGKEPVNMATAITSGSLPIIPIRIQGPKGWMKIFALLDSGSNCTMIEDQVAVELGIFGTKEQFSFRAFNDEVHEEPDSQIVNFKIAGAYRKAQSYDLNNVHTVRKLGVPGINVNVEKLKEKNPHLRSMQAKSMKNAIPQMLIGYKYMKLMAPRKILESHEENSPSAYKCHLGWYICDTAEGREAFCVCRAKEEDDQDLHQMMKEFFSLESFGVKLVKDSQRSKEDKRAIKLLEENTRMKNDRWETCLLWKEDNPVIPESKYMALNRLKSMERKMDADSSFAELCLTKFDHYKKQGYLVPKVVLEKNRSENVNEDRRWYLPWFIRFHSTKKPRLVFDAAAKSNGKCLNDFLLKGPDLLRPLPAVLIRFRMHAIALTADIREMFHQVSLRDKDRPSQTVLFRGMDRKVDPIEYEMTALFFGSSSSPSSAIFTKDKNASQYEDIYPEAVKAISLNFFMDDFLGGEEDEEKAIKLHKQITEIHQKGGFPLVKWNSNSDSVLQSIQPELRANGDTHFSRKEDIPMEKALGMYWDSVKDEFGYKLSFSRVPNDIVNGERCPTKRMMTGLIMALFDPIGFIAHFRIKGLIILQNVWRSEVGWDDEIPQDDFEQWKLWLQEMKGIEQLRIPRRLLPHSSLKTADNLQLHIFCDASSEAFSCSAYLRINTGGRVLTPLVMAKARVAPLKGQTIPRLECQAAVLGCRVSKAVREAFGEDLKLNKTTYWTDSRTVLCWVRSSSIRYNQFVAARIGEILELSNVDEWRWVPTADNPSDDATRLAKPADLTRDSRFLNGPEFLRMSEENWPQEDKQKTRMEADLSEQKAIHVLITVEQMSLPDISRFSCWFRLIRATACTYQAIRSMRKQEPNHITILDMKKAMDLWIRKSQIDAFPEELRQLKSGNGVSRSSRLFKLSPAINEDGIIVLKGRINNAKVGDSVKYPPILDPKHKYTQLMVKWFHQTSCHFGQERVVNELRKHAWIINCRAAVRRCVGQCLICKQRKAQPVSPEMGQLPFGRLEAGKPVFYYCSVDYFGPYLVKVKRSACKRWGVLFSCQTTRAVHLEVADSLDTSSMINALTRFVNIRGKPAHIWSDNGTNFVGAEREIRESLAEWNQDQIRNQLAVNGIQWHFIPPSSPHMGGSWERLVGSSKKILSSILKEQKPADETLRTLFTEVMGILNSRPITYASPDPDDEKCLTPNDLMHMNCVVGNTIPGVYQEDDMYRKSWRYGQMLAQNFWQRWSKEYLPWLAKRQKWHQESRPIQVGDIVIVLEDNAPRNHWKKGVITATFPGKDNQVRVVEVKVAHVDPRDPQKRVKTSYLRRPTMKICPLSISSCGTEVPGRENVAERNGEE